MSYKVTCPGCNARLSSVAHAFAEGDPCPNCGLPAEAAAQVFAARESAANAELKQRHEALLLDLGRVTAERDDLRRRLEQVHEAVEDWKP